MQTPTLPSLDAARHVWSEIWHQEAHNSTAIEGNTLVLAEVEQLLEEGRAVGNKPLAEYTEVKGYADTATWVYGQAAGSDGQQPDGIISLQEVREIHYTAMEPVWSVAPHPHATDDEAPGSFRRHEIKKFPGGMTPPPWTEVDHLMRDWVSMADRLTSSSEAPLAERLAELHNRFERVHPFLDGNGRTGRLALNLVLGRLGYPPAIIYKRDRDRYLQAMRRADHDEFGPLGELIAQSGTANLYRFVVPAVASPFDLVPLSALLSPWNDMTEDALRIAASRGRLRAVKGDDQIWRSTKQWVADYRGSRYKRS